MSIGRKYALPICLGFVGMIVCHIIILIGFGSGIQYPIYIIVYPVVYPLIAAILATNNVTLWMTDAIFLNALPFLYWYLLLWNDDKFTAHAALSWQSSSGMLLIMPLTIGLTLAVSFAVSRSRKGPQGRTDDGGVV